MAPLLLSTTVCIVKIEKPIMFLPRCRWSINSGGQVSAHKVGDVTHRPLATLQRTLQLPNLALRNRHRGVSAPEAVRVLLVVPYSLPISFLFPPSLALIYVAVAGANIVLHLAPHLPNPFPLLHFVQNRHRRCIEDVFKLPITTRFIFFSLECSTWLFIH